MKEEPEDKSNGSIVHQKRRRRSVVLSDSKDEENENSRSEKNSEKAVPKSTRSVHAKNRRTKVEHEGSDVCNAKDKSIIYVAIRMT